MKSRAPECLRRITSSHGEGPSVGSLQRTQTTMNRNAFFFNLLRAGALSLLAATLPAPSSAANCWESGSWRNGDNGATIRASVEDPNDGWFVTTHSLKVTEENSGSTYIDNTHQDDITLGTERKNVWTDRRLPNGDDSDHATHHIAFGLVFQQGQSGKKVACTVKFRARWKDVWGNDVSTSKFFGVECDGDGKSYIASCDRNYSPSKDVFRVNIKLKDMP